MRERVVRDRLMRERLIRERDAQRKRKMAVAATPKASGAPGYDEQVHANQIGEVVYVSPFDQSVCVEWITAATDDADLIKGPGQLLKRRDLKKINKLDHVVYKYE